MELSADCVLFSLVSKRKQSSSNHVLSCSSLYSLQMEAASRSCSQEMSLCTYTASQEENPMDLSVWENRAAASTLIPP